MLSAAYLALNEAGRGSSPRGTTQVGGFLLQEKDFLCVRNVQIVALFQIRTKVLFLVMFVTKSKI